MVTPSSDPVAATGVDPRPAPSGAGCASCDAAQPQGWWFHLRRCAQCGAVGCCDSSPGQHASAHAASAGHPVMVSYEPGEDWAYDTRDGSMTEPAPVLAPPRSHPGTQPVPGPAGRVPRDWMTQLHA